MKKRIFITILLLLILFVSIPIKSNASISYQGKAFPEFPEGWNEAKYKFICYFPEQDCYVLIISNSDRFCFNTTDDFNGIYNYLCVDQPLRRYRWFPKSQNEWEYRGNNDGKNLVYNGWELYGDTSENKKQMIYSNVNIPIEKTEEVFFYKTPLLNFTTMQRAIGGTFWQILMKTLTILVPLGLTIFGAFCVVYLIGSKKWLPVKPNL